MSVRRIHRYELITGMGSSITLEIDVTDITEAQATETNEFWSHSAELLKRSDGDVYQACARRMAGEMLLRLMQGYTKAVAAPVYGTGTPVSAGALHGFWQDADWPLCRDGKWRPVESGSFPLANGLPSAMVRLRGYGNAINPWQAAQFIEIAQGWAHEA